MSDERGEEAVGAVKGADKPEPRTLPALLRDKDAKASAFIDALDRRTVPLPTQAELDEATEILLASPELLPRVAELARVAADSQVSPVAQAILGWSADVLRESDARYAEWMKLGGAAPDSELRQLAERVNAAKDKSEKAAAEARLSIGLAVLTRQFNLVAVEALRTLAHSLGNSDRSPAGQNKDKRRALTLLRRAGGKQLENLALVARLFEASLNEARQKQAEAEAARRETYDRYVATRTELDRRQGEVEKLTAELQRLQSRIEDLGAELTGVQGDAAHGEIELKARYRQLLRGRLTPFLNDARDALSSEPPFADVAAERLKLVQTEIEREMGWLDKSSD